jgi:hypothetical protein
MIQMMGEENEYLRRFEKKKKHFFKRKIYKKINI